MIFGMAKFIAGLFGLDIQKVQKWVIFGLFALVGIAVLALGLWLRSCWTAHKLKVSQEQIQKINEANRAERIKELQKIVDDNADVIKTVDNRTALSETNVVERNRMIDDRVREADKAIEAAKQQGKDVSGEELDCLLIPEHCQGANQ